MEIKYIQGDATNPVGEGRKIITHICNDIGGWGRGFVLGLSSKWKEPEMEYRKWHRSHNNFHLGEVQFVKVQDGLCVANMIAQHKVWAENGIPPIRYDSLRLCLEKVCEMALRAEATVHMPKIGSGLAGGDWNIIEEIIKSELVQKGVNVTVYEFIK